MLRYTKSALLNTYDFVKRLISIFQIGIQLVYVLYIVFRLVANLGNLVANIILMVVSAVYLVFQIVTTREFQTKRQIFHKKVAKWIFKTSKYLVYLFLITISTLALIGENPTNENATILMTMLMIVGVILSIILDIILVLIDNQITLVVSALKYDIKRWKANNELVAKIMKSDTIIDQIDDLDEKTVQKVNDAHHRQIQKTERKTHFKLKLAQKIAKKIKTKKDEGN